MSDEEAGKLGATTVAGLSAIDNCSGHDSMVKLLLEEGADASKTDSRGMTALAYAAKGGKLLAVRALLRAKTSGNRCVPRVGVLRVC